MDHQVYRGFIFCVVLVPFWTSYRLRLAILCSVGLMMASTYRAGFSLAMVCMINDEEERNMSHGINSSYHFKETTTVYEKNKTKNETTYVFDSSTGVCPIQTKTNLKGVEFNWSKRLQGFMLGSFFWGYPVFQIPGGWMAWRFGAKRVITVGIMSEAVLNLITPRCARATPYLVIINRALTGMAHSVLSPACVYLFQTWSPPGERSRIISLVFAGTPIGTALTFPISGMLCDYGIDGGWPSIFYLLGTVGVIWIVVWLLCAHDNPNDAPRLNREEKRYLQKDEHLSKMKKKKTPWRSILVSRSTWACVLSHLAMDFGNFLMLTQLPTYMNEVLRFKIMSNGLFRTLPYVGMFTFTNIGGFVSDKLIETKTLSRVWTRKFIAVVGYIVPAVLLIVMGTWDCTQQTPAVITLILLVSVTGLQMPGIAVNYAEIGGQFSGVLFGIGNVLASIAGITAPYLVAVITPHKTQEEWMKAFIVAACVYVVGAFIYCTMTKFELEPWAVNDDPLPEIEIKKTKDVFSVT